jgi:hypothetical protein
MAEGTRMHQLSESLKECQDAITQQHLTNATVQTQLREVTDMLRTLLINQPPPDQPPFLAGQDDRHQHDQDRHVDRDDRRLVRDDEGADFHRDDRHIYTRTLRLDFPRFDGVNPSGWSYKVNQFFSYYQTPPNQRIRMASFHMEGEVLVWFQDADEAGLFPTWEDFLQALLTRFGPVYDDPMESLMKLRQISTVAEYTTQFEALSNRLRGISDRNRLSCFLSGLKDEVRLPLKMLNPLTLVAAFGLAKLQKEYLVSTLRQSRSGYQFNKPFP